MNAAAIVTTICVLSTGSAALALELNVTSGLPAEHIVEKSGNQALIACVSAKSGGDITFNYYPSGQIVSAREGVEALEKGLADISFVSPVLQSARLPLNGLPLLPGLGRTAVEMTQAYRAVVDGDNPIAREIRDLGMRALVINALPPYQVVNDGPPITALDDFKGMKLRAAGSSMLLTIDALGATAVEMAAGDMYVAMQRGTIDATLLSSVNVPSYALQELAKSMSRNGNFGTSTTFFAISDASWAKLSPDQQAVLSTCAVETEEAMARLMDEMDAKGYADIAAAGVELYDLNPELAAEIDARLIQVADTFIQRLEDAGVAGAREGYEAFQAALGR